MITHKTHTKPVIQKLGSLVAKSTSTALSIVMLFEVATFGAVQRVPNKVLQRMPALMAELKTRNVPVTERILEAASTLIQISYNPELTQTDASSQASLDQIIAQSINQYLNNTKLLEQLTSPMTVPPISRETITFLNLQISPAISWRDPLIHKGFTQPGGQNVPAIIEGKKANLHIELAIIELASEVGNGKQCFVDGLVRKPLGLPVLVTINDEKSTSFYACLKIGLFGTQFDQLKTLQPRSGNFLHGAIRESFKAAIQKDLGRLPPATRAEIEKNLEKRLPAFFPK